MKLGVVEKGCGAMKFRGFLSVCALAALSACGIAPQPSTSLSPPAADKARLYFYRDANVYDGLLWTDVSLNGQPVGASAPGTVFYRDVPPGIYRIEARSEKLYPDQNKTVVVKPGTTTFVKIQTQPYWGQSGRQWVGNTFVVAIVNPAVARDQIEYLRLTPG